MNIFYITDNILGIPGNGISSQAITWANILEKYCSQKVDLVNQWDSHNYGENDIIHLFGSSGTWFYNVTRSMKGRGCKVIWSPICDNIDNPRIQKVKSYMGSDVLQVFSYPYIRKKTYKIVDRIFVRSNYEKQYLKNAFDVPANKFSLIPLSLSYNDNDVFEQNREPFCLHISSISQPRKNVVRLVEAAKKYKFKLVLAGNKGSDKEFEKIKAAISDAPNIEVLGFISEEEKIALYKKAKVFALPSISEGVGIVALDAAHFGCDIVITEIGGPKEYYADNAKIVNPYNTDDIGTAIKELMSNSFQPGLKKNIDDAYSQEAIANKLFLEYKSL